MKKCPLSAFRVMKKQRNRRGLGCSRRRLGQPPASLVEEVLLAGQNPSVDFAFQLLDETNPAFGKDVKDSVVVRYPLKSEGAEARECSSLRGRDLMPVSEWSVFTILVCQRGIELPVRK